MINTQYPAIALLASNDFHPIDGVESLWQHKSYPNVIKDVDRILVLDAIKWRDVDTKEPFFGNVENICSALELIKAPGFISTFEIPVIKTQVIKTQTGQPDEYRIEDVKYLKPVWKFYKRPDFDLMKCYG